jgi:hypothetical protein
MQRGPSLRRQPRGAQLIFYDAPRKSLAGLVPKMKILRMPAWEKWCLDAVL